jgi:hypothetical protein
MQTELHSRPYIPFSSSLDGWWESHTRQTRVRTKGISRPIDKSISSKSCACGEHSDPVEPNERSNNQRVLVTPSMRSINQNRLQFADSIPIDRIVSPSPEREAHAGRNGDRERGRADRICSVDLEVPIQSDSWESSSWESSSWE